MSDRERPKKFEDVDKLRDAAGVCAVITRTLASNSLAVAFFKEFSPSGDDDGALERTAFMRERQLEAVERLIPLVRARLAELKIKYPVPAKDAVRG